MKFHLCLTALLSTAGFCTYSQSVAIGAAGVIPDSSAALDLQPVDKGFLLPRMTQAARLLIQQPATGLLVYQTDSPAGFYFNTGTPDNPAWVVVSGEKVFVRDNGVIHAAPSPANDLIFGRRDLPGTSALNNALFWFQKDKGAFRNGLLASSGWTSIAGAGSFATGRNTRPTGQFAFASGDEAKAGGAASFSAGTGTESAGNYSLATGLASKANGPISLASGLGTQADGILTQAFGDNTKANTINSFVVGLYNDPMFDVQTDTFATGVLFHLRPHFIAGMGQHQHLRLNAMSVHRTVTILQNLQIGNGTAFTNLQSGRSDYINSCDNCILNVTFNTPYPTAPSKVFATIQTNGDHEVYSCTVRNITATGFTVQVRRESGSSPAPSIVVLWSAIQ